MKEVLENLRSTPEPVRNVGFTTVHEPVKFFLCFAATIFLGSFVLASLFFCTYVTRDKRVTVSYTIDEPQFSKYLRSKVVKSDPFKQIGTPTVRLSFITDTL